MTNRIFICATLLACTTVAAAQRQQRPPANPELFLTTVNPNSTPMIAASLTNISNNPGYDSQPGFLPDGSAVLFSSTRGATVYDIYKYDIATRKLTQLTSTPDWENSPIVTPDGKAISVVRSELPAGADNQRLWRMNLNGSNQVLVLPDRRRVAYYVWVDATHVAIYFLGATGSPGTLQYVDTTTGKADVIDSNIGRSLLLRPGTGAVTYVSQPRGGPAVVKQFDPKTLQTSTLVDAFESSTNYDAVWHPSGVLFMSAGTKVFAWKPGSTSWTEAGDFAAAGVTNITRMAIEPNAAGRPARMVLVADVAAR